MTGPGAALSDQARDDLAAMFAAYDDSGLVGDPTVLPAAARAARRRRGRPVCHSRRRPPPAGDSIGAMSDEQTWLDHAVDLATANVARGGGPFGAVVVRDAW